MLDCVMPSVLNTYLASRIKGLHGGWSTIHFYLRLWSRMIMSIMYCIIYY